MRSYTFFLLAFASAACHDFTGQDTLPTGPRPHHESAPASIGSPSQFWSRLSAEERQAAIATIARVYAEQDDVYLRGGVAVADGDLPGGRSAMVLRDPNRPERPLLVLSGSSDEQTAVNAMTAFHGDRTRASSAGVGDALWSDRPALAQDEHALPPSVFELDATPLSIPRIRPGTSLTGSTSSKTRVEIPGVGRGTLLRFE